MPFAEPPSYLPPNTLLQIVFPGGSTPGINPYSARQLHQTLVPIEAVRGGGVLRRNVNGGLVDISPHQMRKYRSDISGSDQAPPAIDGIWPGMIVTVNCVAELAFPNGTVPQRPVVPGTQRVEDNYTYYCPQLTMMISDFSVDKDEWGAITGWRLALEET